jgi:hypothetical protein
MAGIGFILFFLALTAINTRSTSDQLVLSIYPHVKPIIFPAMLVLIAFSVYKGGFTVIARMGEILLPVFVSPSCFYAVSQAKI